ncbi:benenodin family lasso peptide [Sphingomonas sp. GM_Shp_1]|nr:benenodin family lasso peptide [Sphingomonas sp. GM_Shp_1]
MERDTDKAPTLVDLGDARVLTQGATGTPIDEVQGMLGAGLADD